MYQSDLKYSSSLCLYPWVKTRHFERRFYFTEHHSPIYSIREHAGYIFKVIDHFTVSWTQEKTPNTYTKQKELPLCTFKNRSIIFSSQLWQSKSLWCWQFTVVSLFGPSNVGLWISSSITEQDQPTSFYNLISWRGMVNIRGDCKNKTSNTMIMRTKNYTKITRTKCLNQVQCASHYLQHVQVPCNNPIENL